MEIKIKPTAHEEWSINGLKLGRLLQIIPSANGNDTATINFDIGSVGPVSLKNTVVHEMEDRCRQLEQALIAAGLDLPLWSDND